VLARYTMYRGKRPASDPLPSGVRQDTRKHTRHCLRPTEEMVRRYLTDPVAYSWRDFKTDYMELVRARYDQDRRPFDLLSTFAQKTDVFLGCSCPTKKNPDVAQCHTVLALEFMRARYKSMKVAFPSSAL
jgi:hypothetical protein